MDSSLEASEAEKLNPLRIVYHRGSIIYARLKAASTEDYRHPLDVPNGLACGCTCDECGEDLLGCANVLEKVEAGEYKKIPYFAHQSSTQCTPSGERGLAEAFRLAIAHFQSLHLPEARFSSGAGDMQDCIYQRAETVSVSSCEIAPKVGAMPYQLLLSTSKGDLHFLVLTKRLLAPVVLEIKGRSVPTIAAFIMPDFDGVIRMKDVIRAVMRSSSVSWISLPEMDVFAAEQRHVMEIQQDRGKLEEAERLAVIQQIEEARQTEANELRRERVRQLEEDAKMKGLARMVCAGCKEDAMFAKPPDAWLKCPVCKRYTFYFPG